KEDFSNATEVADYLAKKGMPFREAHEIVGKLVYTCIQKGIYLSDLPFETFTEASDLFEEDIYTVLGPYVAVEKRTSAGGTGFKQIQLALEKAKACLA
ncbi:argininosuccinate lyase, partial [Bacillus subtilis]